MPIIVYNSQVLIDELGKRWQVVRNSIEEDYAALVSLTGPRAVEVRLLTELLAALASGKAQQVANVLSVVKPQGPGLRDARRSRHQVPGLRNGGPKPVRVAANVTGRACREQLLQICLARFLNSRKSGRSHE